MKLTEELQREKQAIESGTRLHWIHWLVVGLSLLITYGAWHVSKESIQSKTALQFDRQADQAVELVSERMLKYEDGLWGGVSAIQANGGDMTRSEWLAYAKSLRIEKKYPGINGIGVIHYVAPQRMESYLTEQRIEQPDYGLHPKHNRSEYWPITYIEPVATNAKAVGLDMAHETNRYTAALKARDSGLAQITGPITLVQDSARTAGFLFYAPFYEGGRQTTLEGRREHVTGLVYAPFVVNKLMEGTLRQEKRQVGIKITDGDQTLYNEHVGSGADYDPNPLFTKRVEMSLYGRTWIFDIRSTTSFRNSMTNNQPLVILIGGILIDMLLLVLFVLLAHSNKRSSELIAQLTKG